MAFLTEFRPTGHGLHPRHYDALRHEILRTGAALSDDQLFDLTEALRHQVQTRRPAKPSRRSLA
tara:strand:- start:218 stop:409 length:192 start_codon:yes stop_codon:yes gene_type:complete